MTVTYLTFALAFVVGPVVVLAVALAVTGRWHPAQLLGTALLVGVALVYTLPWDDYLIRVGVWTYGSTLVGRVGAVPYEEVLFVTSQTLMTGLWTTLVVRPDGTGPSMGRRRRVAGLLSGLAVGGLGLLVLSVPSGLYLGAILAWAGPVLAVQWAFNWEVLLRNRRTVLLAIGIPTCYLWLVDRAAIALGLWAFSPARTTGIAVLGLPIEEALFFLVTNVFLVQGLVLFGWLVERDGLPSITDAFGSSPGRAE